jgi:N-acetylglutamate synthase-like GNAT family acetyltransferase
MDSNAVFVRKMRDQDMDEVLVLLSKWNMAPRPPSPRNPKPESTCVQVQNSFVAVVEERVVGVASYIVHTDTSAETASLAVDPAFRGRGVGKMLQLARLEEMKQRGIRTVQTETDRPETIRWYVENFGYRIAGTNPKKHRFSLPGVDHWTVLELEL